MNANSTDWLHHNRIFVWLALATGLLLLVPLVAMQYSEAVAWSGGDFLVMGALIFGFGSLFVVVSRRLARNYRLAVGISCAVLFLYLWAELAVGVFTQLGS